MVESGGTREACSVGRNIIWSKPAWADVVRLVDFLWSKHEGAAERAAQKIMEAEELLKGAPRIGRPISDGSGRRELTLNFGSGAYIISYVLEDEETVLILRVWHSREQRF